MDSKDNICKDSILNSFIPKLLIGKEREAIKETSGLRSTEIEVAADHKVLVVQTKRREEDVVTVIVVGPDQVAKVQLIIEIVVARVIEVVNLPLTHHPLTQTAPQPLVLR